MGEIWDGKGEVYRSILGQVNGKFAEGEGVFQASVCGGRLRLR